MIIAERIFMLILTWIVHLVSIGVVKAVT